MKKFTNGVLLFSMLILIISGGCNNLNEFDDKIETDREFAVPLLHMTTSLTDLLDGLSEETYITMGPDDLITLNYKGNVTEQTGEQFFTFLNDLIFPLPDSVVTAPFDLPGTVDITLMKLKAGQLISTFKNQHDDKVDFTLRIPQLTKNGAPFTRTGTLGKAGTTDSLYISFASMQDYQIQSANDSIDLIYEAYLQTTGERVLLNEAGIVLLDIEFSYLEGYWGTEILDLARDTIEIEFFENWVQGDVFFDDPVIEISVDNSFGFPVRSMTNIMEILTVSNGMVSLESSYIYDGIDFDYPTLSEVGEVKTTIFDFDKDNSNVVEVLSSGPVSVDYDVDAVANPDTLDEIGFITDESLFRVQVAVQLPFHGRVSNFKADDVFDINFEDYNNVDYIEFKMVAENGIPLGIDIQAYFTDENLVIIDSLYTTVENVLAPASVDADGNVTNISEKTTYATLNADQFSNIKNAKKLLLNAVFSTSDFENETLVNLKSDQDVNIRMGIKVGVK